MDTRSRTRHNVKIVLTTLCLSLGLFSTTATAETKLVSKAKASKEAVDAPKKAPEMPATSKKDEPFFRIRGYLQVGYRFTFNNDDEGGSQDRPTLLRLGESDGFYLRRARVNFLGGYKGFRVRVSAEMAADSGASSSDVSPANRSLGLRLRDAFLKYKHSSGFYAVLGQTNVPFGLNEARSNTVEHFNEFPLILGGEDIAFGYPVRGIAPRRDIGLKLGYEKDLGPVGIFVKAMVYNGNGPNVFANDSDMPAVAGRLGVNVGKLLRIGGSVLWNPRRAGEPPQLYDETDLTFGADLSLNVAGFFLEGAFAMQQTSFPTTGQETATAWGFHADLGYRIKGLGLEPAVRFEMFDPSDLFDDDQLTYITIGVNWYKKVWRHHELAVRLSYVIKMEQVETRQLLNDQINLRIRYRL